MKEKDFRGCNCIGMERCLRTSALGENIYFTLKYLFGKKYYFSLNFSFPNFPFKENFLLHPHKAATHNACALV